MYPTWPSKKLRESGSFLHNAQHNERKNETYENMNVIE